MATLLDVEQLRLIGRLTFNETFANTNSKEDMQKYLTDHFSTKILTPEINNPTSQLYLAKINNLVVGYLKINWAKSQTETNHANALEIERIYVLKEYFGQQIGKLLYDKALQIAQDKNLEYIWLGVWEHNPRAIRFYEKNGFVAFDKHVFTVGSDDQIDILMKLKL